MPIDFSSLNLSEQVIDGLKEDQLNWKPASEFPPPPDPGTYRVFIKQIRDVREKMTDSGPRLVLSYDAEILDGSFTGRTIAYNWVSNIEFKTQDRGRTSTLLDLIKSAGVKGEVLTNKAFAMILDKMEGNQQYAFKVSVDWRGSCRSCYAQRLMEQTGDETPELAALHATKEQKDEANKFALKFKNYRQFPVSDNDVTKRKSVVPCGDCGDDIKAMANISRYFTLK